MSQSAEEKITLLVVDDETKNRLLVESILSDDNYELYMAECGMEALLLAEGIEPDLILLDVMMPDMDGYEVCREIRQRPNLTTIPIIMITALDDRDSMLKGLEADRCPRIAHPRSHGCQTEPCSPPTTRAGRVRNDRGGCTRRLFAR